MPASITTPPPASSNLKISAHTNFSNLNLPHQAVTPPLKMPLDAIPPSRRHWQYAEPRTTHHQTHGPSCTCPDCHLRHATNMNAGLRCPYETCFWCETERKLREHHRDTPCTSSLCYSRHMRAKKHVEVCPVDHCVWCEDDHQLRKEGSATCVCQKCWKRHVRAVEDEVECPVTNCAFCEVDDAIDHDDDYEDDFWIRSAAINDDEDYEDDDDWSRSTSVTGSYSSGGARFATSEGERWERYATYYPCCGRFCKAKRCKKHRHLERGVRVPVSPKTAYRRY